MHWMADTITKNTLAINASSVGEGIKNGFVAPEELLFH